MCRSITTQSVQEGMPTMTSIQKMSTIVQKFHNLCNTNHSKETLTIAILKALYNDYKEANSCELVSLRELVVDIIKQICEHIGANDTKSRSSFYQLWVKLVHNLALTNCEQQSLNMIVTFVHELKYTYQVIFEADNRYYHMYNYTISKGNTMSLTINIQDIHDPYDIAGGKTFTIPFTSANSPTCEDNEIHKYMIYDDITMFIRFGMLPCKDNKKMLKLSRYVEQKSILETMIQVHSSTLLV